MIIILPLLFSLLLYLLKEKTINHSDDTLLYGCFSIIFSLIMTEYIPVNISSEKIILFFITILIIYQIDLNKNSFFGSFFLLSVSLAIFSFSIFSFFLTVEMISFLVLILLNLYVQDQYPGIIYYLFSGLFSALFLLSLGYLSMGYFISYSLISVVFFYKLGLVPFHFLLPHLYNSISPRKIFLFDIPSKLVLFYLYFRISSVYIDLSVIIILSLLVGSIGALRYQNLLTILVYSSIANYGIILLIISYNEQGSFLFFIIIYSLMVLIYLYLIISKQIDKKINNYYYIIFFFILIINLMGIPPFSGFQIKFIPLFILIENYYSSSYLFIIISFSFILLGFTYLRILLSLILKYDQTPLNNNMPKILNNKDNNLVKESIIVVNNKNVPYAHFISSLLVILSFPIFIF